MYAYRVDQPSPLRSDAAVHSDAAEREKIQAVIDHHAEANGVSSKAIVDHMAAQHGNNAHITPKMIQDAAFEVRLHSISPNVPATFHNPRTAKPRTDGAAPALDSDDAFRAALAARLPSED